MLKRFLLISSSAIIAVSIGLLLNLPTPPSSQYDLLIRGSKIWMDGSFTQSMDIAVADGRIAAIDSSLNATAKTEVDGDGKYLLPALTDAHTHTFGSGLSDAVRFGVGTHIDMFTDQQTMKASKVRDEPYNAAKADLYTAGMLATAPRGHGTQFGSVVDTLTEPTQAMDWVRKRKSEGSDFIKLVYMPESTFFNSIDLAIATAVIDAAHQEDLMVVAHISTQAAAKDLMAAGIDGLVHQFADTKVDDEFLQLAQQTGLFVIPTLSVIGSVDQQGFADQLAQHQHVTELLSSEQQRQLQATFGSHSLPGFDYTTAEHNTLAMHRAGIPILAGSDAPNPGTTYGASLHQEIHLLAKAGLGAKAAMAAATALPNRLFELGGRGTLKVGAPANLLLLNASPLDDIENTLDIDRVFKNGVLVKRDLQTKNGTKDTEDAPRTLPQKNLSDFANGLTVNGGLRWMATDDRMRQGTSQANIELVDQSLKVNTQVTSDFMFPWAGAAVFASQPKDLSRYSAVTFQVRGSVGEYSLMAFSGSLTSMPAVQAFSIEATQKSESQTWQQVTLRFDDFNNFDASEFLGFAFVANTPGQTAEFFLSEINLSESE